MLIKQTPCFSLKDVIKRRKGDIDVYPLNSKNCHLFYGARYAIWAGIKALGIAAGKNILIPSYNCGTEIDPILNHEIQVKYYRIKKDMTIDLGDLIKQIDSKTAAILAINYIGFPQPLDEIKKICETYGLFLIEDCAHAFLSAHNLRNLGTFGDISVFSIRKTLPSPNGGALVVNNENFKFEEYMIKSSALSTFFVAVELLKNRTQKGAPDWRWRFSNLAVGSVASMNYILRLMLRVFKKLSLSKGLALIHINFWCRDFQSELAKWNISTFSERIINNADYKKIKEKRRENFEYLLMNLPKMQDIEIVFDRLPEGVCPLFFPIIVKDRQYYYQKFKDRGIISFQYWQHKHHAVPWEQFPDAVFLKEHVLGLPIHQDINVDHLNYIIEVFNDINKLYVE